MATKRVALLVFISILISVTAIIVATSSTTFSRYDGDNDSSSSSSLPSTKTNIFKKGQNSTEEQLLNPIEDDTSVNSTWDDVNLFSSKECGNYKCFFPSKTNPEEVGYLVARETDRMYDRMMHGWNIAKQIEKLEHNNNTARRHFYLTSPMLKEVAVDDERLRKRLNRKLPKRRSMTTGGVKKPAANVFVFQKVKRAAPSDHTILRCQQKWIADSIMSVFKILGGNKRNNNNHLFSISTTTRADTFFNEINDLIILIQHSKPDLVQDFQVLVDNQGLIYHFDLDRAIKYPSEEDLHICICNLRKMSILIRHFFSDQQQNASSSSSSSLHDQKELASKIFSVETSNEERLELLSTKSRFENVSECQSH